MRPRTFLSLIQKIGRCVRDHMLRGLAVLYITKAMYSRCVVELDVLKREEENSSESESEDEEDEEGAQRDRDAAAAVQDASDDDTEPPPKRRKLRGKRVAMSPLERRDRRYLLEYIVTDGCRRIPWNKFFGKKDKGESSSWRRLLAHSAPEFADQLSFPVPDGPCCDNCDPEKLAVERVALVGGQKLKTGRREKSSPELEDAVREKLHWARKQIIADHFPRQHFLTGEAILADDIVDTLAQRARHITSVDTLLQQSRWSQATRFGDFVVKAIQDVVILFPDLAKEAREQEAAERTQKTLDAAAAKELRARLVLVFDGCLEAVTSQYEAVPLSTRKSKTPKQPRRICQLFMQVPRRNGVCIHELSTIFLAYLVLQRYSDYYDVIPFDKAISIKNIKTCSQKPTYYETLADYRADWHRLFDNARTYNMPGSQIYTDADFLQTIFDQKLYVLSALHDIPGHETLTRTYLEPAFHCH
jgi:hypothetical protein